MDLVKKSTKRKNHNQNFIKRISPLIEYFKEHGTLADIKQTDTIIVNGEVVRIGWLITNLRQEKRKGLLQDTDIVFLDYFDMNWGDTIANNIDVIKHYYKNYKSFNSLTQYSKDYNYKGKKVNIGSILANLRTDYKEGRLTEQQIKELVEMGLKLAPKKVDNVLAPLTAYYQKFETLANIKNNEEFEFNKKIYKIGRQINYFRTKYHKGELKQEYIQALNSMGMRWSAKKQVEEIVEL